MADAAAAGAARHRGASRPGPRAVEGVDVMMSLLVVVWGTAFVGLKVVGEVLDPFQIVWFRFLPFLLVFGTWLAVRKRAVVRAIPARHWGRFAILGLLGVVGYHVPVNYGLAPAGGVTAATGAILVATTPLWTLLFAVVSGGEAFDGRKAIGSAVAFAGVGLVVLRGSGETELTVAARASVILIAAVLWSLYNVLGKPLAQQYGGRVFTAVSFSLGTLFLLPYGLWVGVGPLGAFAARHWFWVLYLGLAATVVGYAIWNHALQQRQPSEVTAFIYVIPVVATLAGAVLLGETITVWFVVGAALVLGGVIEVNRARLRAAAAAAANA